ncbi:MAG: pyruvate kinase, pyruvate kinase, partial [Candidatus Peregrinibacteria bacterium GW2011_GWE2_39_6]
MKRKTKIVCTLGPSTDSVTEIERLLEAGMNVARLNFSHGSYEYMEKILKNLKEACLKTGKSVAILQDLQGPKIRLGKLPEKGIPVKRGEIIILSTDGKSFNPLAGKMIPVQYRSLHKDVKSKDLILIDDGYIEVQVQKIVERKIYCKVKTSGVLKSHKGVNCPTASIKAASITAKDLADLKFGLKNEIDYVALSFVRKAEDIENLRKKLIENNHQHVQIIAKIERHEAVKNLKEIAKASDGLMVARGDLGIEIPAEQVPIVQKEIVRIGRILGKPVIIATQI